MQDKKISNKNTRVIIHSLLALIMVSALAFLYWWIYLKDSSTNATSNNSNTSTVISDSNKLREDATDQEVVDYVIKDIDLVQTETTDNDFNDSDISDQNLGL